MFEIFRYMPLVLGCMFLYMSYYKIHDSSPVSMVTGIAGILLVVFGLYLLYSTRNNSSNTSLSDGLDAFDVLEFIPDLFSILFGILKFICKLILRPFN